MEIIDATLKASGWPDAETVLRERWIDAMPAFEDAHFLDRLSAAGQALSFRSRLGAVRRQPRDHAEIAGSHGQ